MTRYAVLSDVHGNLEALQAVVNDVARVGADALLCLGDLVGYGPSPNECVQLLADLGALCVAGNHDLMALNEISESGAGDLARLSLSWTRATLTQETRAYLGELPRCMRVDELLLAHGSPSDPREYVRSRRRAAQLLEELPGHGARFLLLGHTHRPWAYGRKQGTLLAAAHDSIRLCPDRSYLLNPGSVGQSRDRSADARYLVLDVERGRATFRKVGYDVAACRAALQRVGLPVTSYQLLPSRRRQTYERFSHALGVPHRLARRIKVGRPADVTDRGS